MNQNLNPDNTTVTNMFLIEIDFKPILYSPKQDEREAYFILYYSKSWIFRACELEASVLSYMKPRTHHQPLV